MRAVVRWPGTSLVRVLGAGAVVVVAAGAIAAALRDGDAPVSDQRWRPFYLEAEGVVSSNALTIGTNIAGSEPPADPDESRLTIRWWWRDRDHFRAEFITKQPALESGTSVFVGDGQHLWYYKEDEATYERHALDPFPDGYPCARSRSRR